MRVITTANIAEHGLPWPTFQKKMRKNQCISFITLNKRRISITQLRKIGIVKTLGFHPLTSVFLKAQQQVT